MYNHNGFSARVFGNENPWQGYCAQNVSDWRGEYVRFPNCWEMGIRPYKWLPRCPSGRYGYVARLCNSLCRIFFFTSSLYYFFACLIFFSGIPLPFSNGPSLILAGQQRGGQGACTSCPNMVLPWKPGFSFGSSSLNTSTALSILRKEIWHVFWSLRLVNHLRDEIVLTLIPFCIYRRHTLIKAKR